MAFAGPSLAKQQPTISRAQSVNKSHSIKHTQQAVIKPRSTKGRLYHNSMVRVHTLDEHPESLDFYPTALIADDHLLTYIAGTPVVTSPYLGNRPAFDGSDYIVNISSINRDIRLMQQRRSLYRAYHQIGYPAPTIPIVAISGKTEPMASLNRSYSGSYTGDLSLGSSELDVAAILNDKVEAYIGIAYDESPPAVGGQRVANSAFGLNMGFVNIGNLDASPIYFTAGQLYVPFGRFSSAMISAPLTMRLARTKARPFIIGYKSQQDNGPFAAFYGFKSDTTNGAATVAGLNAGYIFGNRHINGELGASIISAINDATGMQRTDAGPGTFGGFASNSNGTEFVKKVPAVGLHGNLNYDRFNWTAEWVTAIGAFRPEDLSFNGKGALPQAAQMEAGVTFMLFNRPSSLALGYQWSKDTLALKLPQHRMSGVFNISIWKDTVESLEYRHDIDFKTTQFANGASPVGVVNSNIIGTGKASDTILLQLGVYF